jgi:hypothetical protein
MRIKALKKAKNLCALKVILGSAMVFAVLLNGVTIGGCSPNVFCLFTLEFYSMRLDLWSGLAAVFGAGLLLSAFKDLLENLRPLELLGRNIESIADLD